MAITMMINLLDALVLGVLKNEDTYGYVLTQRAKQLMDISDSTLYPVLRRLQKDGALTTYDVPFQGRNRRYYSITDKGKEKLVQYIEDWNSYKETVEKVLTGGFENE
ncbi:MAG: PadR family transcriptional regulator [Oscillospiraceae bacterium]